MDNTERFENISSLTNEFLRGKEFFSLTSKIKKIPSSNEQMPFNNGTLDQIQTLLSKPLIYLLTPTSFEDIRIPSKNDSVKLCYNDSVNLKIGDSIIPRFVKNKRFGAVYQFAFILIKYLIENKDDIENSLEFADSLLLDTDILNKPMLSLADLDKVKISSNPIPIYFKQIFHGRYNPNRILSQLMIFNESAKKREYISQVEREILKINITHAFLKKILTKEITTKLNKEISKIQHLPNFLEEQKSILEESSIDETKQTSSNPAFDNFNKQFQTKTGKESELFKLFSHLKVKGRIDFNEYADFIIITAYEPQSYVSGLISYCEKKEIIPSFKDGILIKIKNCFRWKNTNGEEKKYTDALRNHRTASIIDSAYMRVGTDFKDLQI